MDKNDLRNAARTLYGPDLTDAACIRRLAEALDSSPSGVKKWWLGQRQMRGPVTVAVRQLLKEGTPA